MRSGYSGTPKTLDIAGDGIKIKQGKIDDNELVTTKPSEMTMTVLCRTDGDPYTELFTLDPLEFRVFIGVCRTLANGGQVCMRQWEGYLEPVSYSQPFDKAPYQVTLKATDGLAILKNIDFLDENAERYTGRMPFLDMFWNILSHIDAAVTTWPLAPVRPAQTKETLALLGADMDALYTHYDGVPRCYDVLTDALSTFGLQLFQSFSGWHIRSIDMLARDDRPDAFDDINSAFGLPVRNNAIPLYSNDKHSGEGMSVAATMTLLPPYRRMTISGAGNAETIADAVGMLDSHRWVPIFKTFNKQWWSTDEFVRMQTSEPKLGARQFSGFAWAGANVLTKAENMSIDISFELFNLDIAEVTVRAGIYLVDADGDPFSRWLLAVRGDDTVTNTADVLAWNETAAKWETLPRGVISQERIMDNYTQAITLEPSKRRAWFRQKMITALLTSSRVSLHADAISAISNKDMRVVVILTGSKNYALPPVELRDPSISISVNDNISIASEREHIDISRYYTEEIAYEQVYKDAWSMPNTANTFSMPLIDVETGRPTNGFVAARTSNLTADLVAEGVALMRAETTMQLQGDVYTPAPVDLNTLYRDRAGRVFYVNYIEYLLRRGVYNVQLRQLHGNAAAATWKASVPLYIDRIVSFDSAVIFTTASSQTIYRLDYVTGQMQTLMSYASGLRLSQGIGAACVCKVDNTVPATPLVSLTAYGATGEVLSHIADITSVVTVQDQYLAAVGREARYNARTNTWITAANIGAQSVYKGIFTGDEEVIAGNIDMFNYGASNTIALPNGFAYTSRNRSNAASYYKAVWNNSAVHKGTAVSDFDEYTEILAMNDIYIVVAKQNTIAVFRRTDAIMGYDEAALLTTPLDTGELVDMNDAVVVLKKTTAGRPNAEITAYDGRTGKTRTFGVPVTLATSRQWLSGSYMYYAYRQGSGMQILRLLLT